MKSKTTSTFRLVIVSLLLLFSITLTGQVKKAFTPRYSETIKGDVTIIANNVLSRHATNAYNGTDGNHDFSNNVFVDIDSDNSTFNSSSANFANPEPGLSCLNFKKVLLYWAAADKEYSSSDNTGNGGSEPAWNYNQVKLMLPGQSTYNTVTADEVIYRGRDEHFVNDPYICVKDITTDVVGLADPYGKFQIANVKATEGDLYSHSGSHTGTSGGWQIVFVYENPSMIGKNVTLFDGYVHITKTEGEVEFDFNGFQTVPTGNVNADIILGSFEGDRDISGDQLQIFDTNSAWSNISTPIRDSNNFFNSRITLNGSDYTDRNPASTNTLGFDAAVFDLQNTGNKFIDNNQTSATLKITSDQESYGLYLLGLSVEVYEPSLGALNFTSSTSGGGFNPGDNVQMTLSVENSGNDDIQNLEIYTILPAEVDFVNTETLPPGVTYNFNTTTRELRFFVPDGNTDVGDPLYTLDFNVQIKEQCYFLETACSANFAMQATATFSGVTNTNPVVAASSGTTDSCGIGNYDPTVVNINEPNQVNWTTVVNALDSTISCDDTDALNTAQNLEPETEYCNFTLNKIAGSFVPNPACPGEGTYTNTWTFTDACGRTSDVFTQVITVEDTTAPTFVETLPADTTVECDNVPVAEILTATDNCDASVSVIFDEQITDSDSCPSDYVITRTWSVEDCAGNTTEHVQTITVEDNTAPVFVETLPADTTVECDNVPVAEVLTATDNCDASVSVIFDEQITDSDSCPSDYVITRTWSVEDCAGNTTEHVQTITVEDNTAPVFVETLPADNTVSCDNVPVAEILTATDNCDASVSVIFDEQITDSDSCPSDYVITRTWSVEDCAGNTTEHVQTITVEDNTAPVFVEALPTDTVAAYDAIPSPETLTAADNCDTNASINLSETYIGDNTSTTYTIVRTWTASDCTGNSAAHTQQIFVTENGVPVGLYINDITVNEDTGNATLEVFHVGEVIGGFTVNHNTLDGTAVATQDYSSVSSNLSFNGTHGETLTSSVPINDDDVIEATEVLTVALTAATNTPAINDNSGEITINDNDGGAGNGISVSDFNVDEDAGTADFTIALNANVQGGFNVDFAIADGTAIAGNDYTVASATGNIVFAGNAGEQHNVTVTILDDALIENSEDLSIALSNLSTGLISILDANGTGTINDNDGGAGNGISVSDFNVDEDAGTADFTIALNANVQGGFNLDFAIADGTAIAGNDYTVASATGNIVFAGNAGEQHNVTVTILDDALIENSEDLSIALSNLSTGLISILDANGTGTINDNDGGAGNGISVSDFNVDEDAGTADFTIALNANVQGGFNVDFAIADGTAIAGNDYTVASATGNIVFAGNAGEQHNVTVTILDDALIENSEDLSIALSNLSTGLISILDANGTGTINDNDGGAGNGISVSDFNVDEDAGTADFTIALNANVQGGFNLDFAIADGTAIAGNDYTVASATGNIVFAGNAGEQHNVTVTILDDALIENSEDLSIALSNLSTGLISILDANGTGTINDNDGGAGNGISVSDFNVDEDAGTADFTIALNANVQGGFNLDFAIADGTAIAGNDYTVASATGNIVFAGNAGEQHNVTVTILDDALIENSEDLSIALSNLSTGLISILDANGTGTINDNDGGAGNGISVSDFNVDEDAGTADFTIALNANVQGGFNVDFAIADGTAIAGNDYTVASATGNIVFAGNAGEQHNVTVTILDDALIENSEDLSIALSNLSTGLISILDANGTGTINDNDGGAGNGISVSDFNVDEDAGTADFTIALNANVQGGFNVDFAIADGTAIAGNDYTVASATGNIVFAGNAGEQHNVTVTILDDALIENSEDLSIALSNLSTGLISILDANGTGTINDNDGGAGNGISVSDFNVDEDAGTADFTIALNANVQGGFNLDFAIADGTAIAGNDYTVASATGNIVFAGNAGEQHNVTVTILDDALIENSEDLSIALSNLSTGLISILDANGTGTINDNDGGAGNGISVSDFNVDEDAGTADFTIALNANVQGGFNVDFAIADGTAIAGNDYTVASATGNIVFAGNAGEQHNVTVTILDDALIENSEDLSIALSNLSTGLISILDANGTGTINDNDGGAGNGISVSDFNVDEDAGTADFTIALNANVQGGFNVDFAIADGTAIAGNDYTVASATGNIVFAGNAGEQHNVTVTILDDALIENSEDLSIALSNLSTGLISILDANGTGTINDNDGGAGNGISVSDFNVDEDAGTADFTIALNANVQGGFNLDFAIADGTAIAGNDYTVASATGNIVFAGNAGEQHNVTVTILDDALIENSEDLSIALSNLSTGLISILDANGTGTINDNDGGAGNGISVSDFNVDEDAGTADFTIALNANVQGGFNLDFAIADGTAIAGNDYTVASATGNIVFAGNAGEQHNVTVTILDDALIENSEDLSIALSNLSTGLISILDANGTGTINDNDGGAGNGVQFDLTNINIDEDAGTVSLPVSLNVNVQEEFTVEFHTTDGTALDTFDYTGVPQNTQVLTFGGVNSNNQNIIIPIIDDIIIESAENFQVILTNISTNLVSILANDTATVSIIDNDGNEGYPTDITIEACGVIPTAEVITINSSCATTVAFNEWITGQDDGCAMDYTITRTWTFTDCVGNVREHVQTITVVDTQAPTFVEVLPSDATVSCDNVPTAAVLTALDSCDPNITVLFDEQITDTDSCGSDYIITRTWSATDCAGNPVNHTQVVTVEDTTAPTFVEALPSDVTVSCDNVPVAETLTAIDNCDTDITVIFDEQITDTDSCGSDYAITRTWSTSDCAGNPVTHVQTITVEDTTAPTFVEALPSDVTVSCDNVPVAETLTAIDNCDTDITVVFDEQITDIDSCGSDYIITRTWSTSDCAGNPVTHVQTITVEDTTAPTFVETLPSDATVSCDNVPVAETLTAIDNCDTNITVVFDEQITDTDSCGSDYIITRTWSTVDCAGNPTTHVQTITVEDTQAPQFVEALPQNVTVMCNEVPDATILTALDNCSTDVSVAFDEIITNDSNCATGYIITRTWSTIDCAGNPNVHTQVITINPTGPIMANDYEAEVSLICGDEIPEVPQLTFTGGCGNYQVEFSEETITLTDTEDFMITRTWDVTDSCGNTASFEQMIFVMQPQPEEVFIDICVEDDVINLINYLPESFDANGVFELVSGNVVLDGSTFNPANLEVGEYLISYSATEGTCKYYVDFAITVNSDCVPCGRNEIIVSNAVTANGDNINDLFTITGVEYCNYSFEVMIFNRWGDKVYESKDYQNDWGGFAPNNAFGNSGMLPSGTYYYIINVKNTDIEPLNGYIYLGTGAN